MRPRGRTIKVLLGLAVSLGLLAYLFWDADLRSILARLNATHPGFFAASVALNLLSIWVRARRWHYLFPPGARPARLFNAVMIGYMGNTLLPLRAGELARAYVVARRGQSFWTTLATLVVERVLDALAILLILAALLFVIPVPRPLQAAAVILVAAEIAIVAVLALTAVAPGRFNGIIGLVSRGRPRAAAWLTRVLLTFVAGLRGVRAPQHILPILASSAAIYLLWGFAYWAALRAAHLDLPLAAGWTVLAFVGLGVSLPSSPGFAGVIQAAAVLALSLFNVGRDDALSFSILLHVSQFFPATIWGLALLAAEQITLSEVMRQARGPAAPQAS